MKIQNQECGTEGSKKNLSTGTLMLRTLHSGDLVQIGFRLKNVKKE